MSPKTNNNNFHRPQISNLTKNLLSTTSTTTTASSTSTSTSRGPTTPVGSSENLINQQPPPQQQQQPQQPQPTQPSQIFNNPSTTSTPTPTHSITNKFIPTPTSNNNNNNTPFANSFTSGSFHQQQQQPPPSHHNPHGSIVTDSIHYIPSSHNTPTAISSSYNSHHSYTASLPSVNNFITQQHQQQQPPTMTSSSYSSSASNFKPPAIVPNPIPTTNVDNDTANRFTTTTTTSSASSSLTQPSSFVTPSQYPPNSLQHQIQLQQQQQQQQLQQQRIPNSLPSSSLPAFKPPPLQSTQLYNSKFQQHQPVVSEQVVHTSGSTTPVEDQSPHAQLSSTPTTQPPAPAAHLPHQQLHSQVERPHVRPFHSTSSLPMGKKQNTSHSFPQQSSLPPVPPPYVPPEPDHYMTYSEFLEDLTLKDRQEGSPTHDQHLNIVEYPVNDLIVMLSCLLTKIIEANDKLHPNHFENTIAIRQKLKEEKRLKKLQKKNRLNHHHNQDDEDNIEIDRNEENIEMDTNHDDAMNRDDDDDEYDDDDDEDDEMKNKYLANVLAFHGTNVPGISLQAYLARVLKYCPVTNEVFLSLLVYFDRIAKKANNLNQKKKHSSSGDNTDSGNSGEAEQLFVMDSYNIHRLIISGITVSSKFFLDIFYKNLRYAKVGGLPLEELNYLELQFLLLLDFKLMISVEDLQNYGDLLLRFWKREQVANELVLNENKEQK
ncbi:PHO85 cyclin-7 [Candida viswanathii]|uniref:PHO85 cyclin-7 n=1 Tax=Candida viswanathii TaxID=5486 RepID=A0A367Y483_9ASCO|nr:PHO85 cyclin-7 [Candida viswanathii]